MTTKRMYTIPLMCLLANALLRNGSLRLMRLGIRFKVEAIPYVFTNVGDSLFCTEVKISLVYLQLNGYPQKCCRYGCCTFRSAFVLLLKQIFEFSPQAFAFSVFLSSFKRVHCWPVVIFEPER